MNGVALEQCRGQRAPRVEQVNRLCNACKELGLNGSFHNSWQDGWQQRWGRLADRLEQILENQAYRFILCLATVGLVVGYVIIASRLAEPPRWVENRFIRIDESFADSKSGASAHDVDAVNRSLVRLEKLVSVLDLKPQRLKIKPSLAAVRTPLEIEKHVLSLWLDEIRGFYPSESDEVISKSIVRAIVALVFNKTENIVSLPKESASWFSQFSPDKVAVARPGDIGPWLTRQIISEGERVSPGQRIAYLRKLARDSNNAKLLEFESAKSWPRDARDFGVPLRKILSVLTPERSWEIDFRAAVPWFQVKLGGQGSDSPANLLKGLHVGLLVVTSCRLPRLADFKGFNAHEVVWARVCPGSLSVLTALVPAETGEEFAIKNPDVSFAQLGVLEISYALEKGWINSKTDISDFIVSTREKSSQFVAAQIRPQREEWDARAQAFRVKAPIEVLKLVRLRSI